jgi:hypothetical protein
MMVKGLNSEDIEAQRALLPTFHLKFLNYWTFSIPQKLALTSPTSGGCLVDIVRSRTEATEFLFLYILLKTMHLEMF